MKFSPLSSLVAFSLALCAGLGQARADGGVQAQGEVRPNLPVVDANSPSGQFGLKSQLAISSEVGATIENTHIKGQSGSTTTITLRPAVDYFIIDNLSLGGFIGLDHSSSSGVAATRFAIGPRVGYNIPLASSFSVWPRAGLSFAHTSRSIDAIGPVPGQSISNDGLGLNLYIPVMFHAAKHFFFGVGPALDVDLTGDYKATTIAGRMTIGGWF